MELTERDFRGGLAGAFGFVLEEKKRQVSARARVSAMVDDPHLSDEVYMAALEETRPLPPLWQRISGLDLKTLGLVEPGSLRAGIRRLLRVVEQLYRAELKSEDLDEDGPPSKLDDATVSLAGRSPFWDPLDEICNVLGIAQRKLSALCAMRTGLKVRELCDCIRAERLRSDLRERFRDLMLPWRESMDTRATEQMAEDFEGSAWRFLKWMRGGGRGMNRKRLAYSYGIVSVERLSRAAFVVEGETLEELELAVAMELIREFFGGVAKAKPSSHGADCSGVAERNPWMDRVLGERRDDVEEGPPGGD